MFINSSNDEGGMSMKKAAVFCLMFLLIAPVFIISQTEATAQNKVKRTIHGTRKVLEEGELAGIQAKKGDKARALLLAATAWALFTGDTDPFISQVIDLAEVDELQFYVDFTAVANTKVKFHFIFTGPEFWTYTDDEWYDAKSNSYDFYGLITTTDWKKGTYTLVVVAEPQTLSSGAECVAMCVFRLE
jgi:hypothetical protein